MCDTLVALGNSTKNGRLLFGKNSDREPDEVQNLLIVPRKDYSDYSSLKVKCTYIQIPQVEKTNRIMLCKPFWMWGAEIGANEHGVVIGNEALFTKVKNKSKKLTGMDLLRLGLERGNTAAQARDVIIDLLEKFGQGGNCGYRHKLYYMNGFIIADRNEAFILETVDREWAWKKVEDVASISNIISIQDDYDEISENLINYAIEKGWWKDKEHFNFQKAYSDKIISWGAAGKPRRETTLQFLKEKKGELTNEDFIQILRTHNSNIKGNHGKKWEIDKGIKGTVCKHAQNSITRPDSTTCSFIAELSQPIEDGKVFDLYLTTGASNTCMSPYFPIFIQETLLPEEYLPGSADYNPASYWWRLEKIHRKAIMNYDICIEKLKKSLKTYETELLNEMESRFFSGQESASQEDINRFFQQALNVSLQWEKEIQTIKPAKLSTIYIRFWKKYNRLNIIAEK